MDIWCRMVSLLGIVVLYGLLLAGVKKYRIKDMVKRLSKKEKLAVTAGVGIFGLGILMKAARIAGTMEGGIVSDSVYWIAGKLLAENVTAVSFVVISVILIPAVFYQVLLVEKIVSKCRISYCQIYYYLMLYVFNMEIYYYMNTTPGSLLCLLAVSALFYYSIELLEGTRGKKSILYLGCYAVGIIALLFLETPFQWQLYAVSAIMIVEGLILAVYRDKSIIFRKTLRRIGTLVLFLLFEGLNYWIW